MKRLLIVFAFMGCTKQYHDCEEVYYVRSEYTKTYQFKSEQVIWHKQLCDAELKQVRRNLDNWTLYFLPDSTLVQYHYVIK